MENYEKAQKEMIKKIDESMKYDFDSPEDFLWFYILGGCGCGNSHTLMNDCWKIFESIVNKKDSFDLIYENKYNEIIAHWLDSKELIEHGTSIAGSWATESGEYLYKVLSEKCNEE
jgi:hypothetical protein